MNIVLIPSYGRPKSVARMERALKQSSTSVEVVWIVDVNDWALFEYVDEFERYKCNYFAVEQSNLVSTLNSAVETVLATVPDVDVIGWIADDMIPLTEGWDTKLVQAVGDLGISYGNDSIQGQNLPTHFFISASIVRKLGYLFPPEFHHLYTDNYVLKVGTELGIIQYVPDVVFDHLHPLVGKAEHDETYTKAWAEQDNDLRVFLNHNYEDTYLAIKELK